MQNTNEEIAENGIPELALKALRDASLHAQASGLAQVVIQDGKLVRIDENGPSIIRSIPSRRKVKSHLYLRKQ